MAKTLSFFGNTINGLKIPVFHVHSGEILRLSFQDVGTCREASKVLTSHFSLQSTSLNDWGERNIKRGLFSKCTAESYLQEHASLSDKEVDAFCSELGIESRANVSSLTDGNQQAVYLKAFSSSSNGNESLILSTVGMHLDALRISYRLLNGFLSKGGACLELTYPPFNDEHLDNLLGVNIQQLEL